MKLNNIFIAIFTVSALLLSGCSKVDDFLGADPSKSTKKVIQTAEQLDQVLSSFTRFYQEQPDMMLAGDDYEINQDYQKYLNSGYNAYQRNYACWNDENTVDTRYHTWGGEYTKVYYANLVINNIDNVEGDEAFKANLKAEAYFLRAYCFFQIALAHTLYYTGSNGDELGITLKLTTSFEESSARASLKDTWDQIDSDLQEALKVSKSLVNAEGKRQTWRGTTAGVKGFAARYYLYRGDYDNAKKYAQEVLSEYSTLKDYNDPAEMYHHSHVDTYTINAGTDAQEVVTVQFPYIYDQMYSQASYINFLNWKELIYARACYYGNWHYIPSAGLIDTYKTDVPGGDPNNDLRYYYYLLPDFGLRYAQKTTNGRIPGFCQFFLDTIISGPTTAEMNLILAECTARGSDWAGSMAYVNKVRKNRIRKDVYTDLVASSQADAVKKVLQERRREMPFVIRWYDLKRLNALDPANKVTVTRHYYEYNETTVKIDVPKDYTLAPDSRHYAIPISSDEISKSNDVIQQNTY